MTTITEPGLVHDMSDETYHSDPVPGGSLSSTFARLLTNHVPAKAKAIRDNRKPTASMNLGRAAHAHALGTGPRLITWEHDGRTKAGKAEREAAAPLIASEAAVAVSEVDRERIEDMARVLREHDEVRVILETTQHEVSGFWHEGPIWCRARYDMLGDRHAWDYKTCQDSSSRAFGKSMASYAYHQQDDLYRRGLRALGHPAGNEPMRFICQETATPYLVQIHTPDETAQEVARELNDRATRIYAACTESGVWPGHDDLFAEPTSLPAYYFYDREDVLPDAWGMSAEIEVA